MRKSELSAYKKGRKTHMDQKYTQTVDSARVIQVIETQYKKGIGTREDPTRIVVAYWSLSGEKLAEIDPVEIQEDGGQVV